MYNNDKKGKYISRRWKCLKTKTFMVNGERREECGGINTRLQPIASTNIACSDQTSTPYLVDENKLESLMSIQRSKVIAIIASSLWSWSSSPRDMRFSNLSDGCMWNRRDWPERTHDLMARALRTPNDARSINHATWLENTGQPYYSVYILQKRPRR